MILFIIINLLVIILGIYYLSRHKDNEDNLTDILKSIVIACITFMLVGSVTAIIQYDNNQNTKNNEPLILESQPSFSNKDNESKLKLKAKQGTVVKGLVVLFEGDNVLYSPIHFNGNKELVSDNFKISSKNTKINMVSTSSKDMPRVDTNRKIIVSQGHLVQLGMILKDSKGNIYSYYYLIRPSVNCKSGMSLKLSVSDNNDTYFYDQKCNNYSKAKILVNSIIIGKDSQNYDLSNIESQVENNNTKISKYKFHLVKPNDRTIRASQFKTLNGKKTLQDDAEPGKLAKVTSDPTTTLYYKTPSKSEIKRNIEILDNIIKNF